MPLINGKRRRFVDDLVLPPVQAQQTFLDKIQAQRRKQEADALLEAIALGECAFSLSPSTPTHPSIHPPSRSLPSPTHLPIYPLHTPSL